jgi:hypothetical protein
MNKNKTLIIGGSAGMIFVIIGMTIIISNMIGLPIIVGGLFAALIGITFITIGGIISFIAQTIAKKQMKK